MFQKMIIVARSVLVVAQGVLEKATTTVYKHLAQQAIEAQALNPKVRQVINGLGFSLAFTSLVGQVSAQTLAGATTKITTEMTALQTSLTAIVVIVCVISFIVAIGMLATKQRGAFIAAGTCLFSALLIPVAKQIPALAK